MNRVKISAFVLALVACAPIAAFAQGAAGNWEFTIDTPQGANTVSLSLAQDGDKLTGTLSSALGSVPVKGTVTGADVTVVADIDAQGTPLTLTFKGKVAADKLDGTVDFGGFGEGPFTGKRAGSSAAAAPSAPRPAAAPAARPAAAPAAPAAGAVSAGDISGKWDVVLSLQGVGEFPMSATIAQSADKVTGMLSTQVGVDVPVSGTMTGNALTLKFTAQTPNGDIPVTMTGTLAGGAFTGKAAVEGLGEADWTGKRAQ